VLVLSGFAESNLATRMLFKMDYFEVRGTREKSADIGGKDVVFGAIMQNFDL
jgi:hypothetical protein